MLRKLSLFTILTANLFVALPGKIPALYGPSGIRPQAVRQGSLGSCYFHSAIAAIAATDSAALQRTIEPIKADQWRVRFADKRTENVYYNDVQYTQSSGFDRSEGLWVSILFRAFAQRTMREGLLEAVAASDLPAMVKSTGSSFFSSSDLLLQVYDRAVRGAVNQDGDINRKQLRDNLDKEMAAVVVPASTRKLVLNMLDSKGYFDALAARVKSNGELFGAYRAVGQGGLPEHVLAAFTGKARGLNVNSSGEVFSALNQAQQSRAAMTACTGSSGNSSSARDWYVAGHAYTILNFDSIRRTVTLRNPWGDHPAPEGIFTIPLDTFVSAYEYIAFADR